MTDMMPTEPETPQEESAPTEESDASTQAPTEAPLNASADASTGLPPKPTDVAEHKGKEGEIEKIAQDFVIPISEQALKEWAKAGPEEYKKYAEQIAQGMYPTFAAQIAAGIPTRILLDPYIEVAKQVLGPVMGTPNWSDPKWSAALQGGVDPKTGRRIPMSLDEWRAHLMSHPGHGWDRSPQAHEKAAHFAQIVNNAFGSRSA
jgi:hypothetical protein